MQQKNILLTVLLLAPFIFGFAIALDIYVPSIPEIRTYFSTSPSMVQWTVSIFILTTGLGQLIVGPLSDAYGRRKVVTIASIIYFIGSVISMLSPNMTILILARMMQGFGACGMMVTCFAIVRDIFSGNECARIYSFLNSTISLSPLLAPSIGGYLALYFGWRATFAFLSIVAFLIVLLAIYKIKESLPIENRVKLSTEFVVNYKRIFQSKSFIMYAFCSCAGFTGFLTFFSVSPYIIIELLQIPKQHFGIYFAAIGLIFFFGSLFCGFLAKKIGTYKTVFLGALSLILAGVAMFLWYLFFDLSIYGFMVPMIIMSISGAFLMGAGAGGAIEPFPDMAGAASALFGCCQFVFGFIVSSFVLRWKIISTLPLASTMMVLGALTLLLVIFLRKR